MNAIQDYLSSINPFGYAREGRMYDKGGVTSSNGQYYVEPSEYSGVLDSAANGNPLEVTLPDTTVTAADPRNYRSYYDPNGFMDFANVVTLGLPNRGSVSQDLGLVRDAYDAFKGNKSWGDVGLSAIMGNKGVFNNPYANLALDFAVPMGIYGATKYIKPRYDFYRAVNEFNKAKPLVQSSSLSSFKDYPLRGESQIPLDIKREAVERYSDFIGSNDYLNRLRNAGLEDHWDYMKGLTNRRVNGNGYFPGNVRDIVDNDLEVLGSSEVEPSFNDYGITLKEDLPISEIPLTLNHEMSHWATGNAGKSDIANTVSYPFKYDPDVSKIGDVMRYNEDIVPNIEWEERYKNLPISTTVDEATKAEKEYQYLIDPQEKRARAYSLYQQAKNMNISTDELVDNYTRNGSITNEAPMELRQMGKILTPKNLKKYLRDFLSLSTPMVLTKTNKNEKYR